MQFIKNRRYRELILRMLNEFVSIKKGSLCTFCSKLKLLQVIFFRYVRKGYKREYLPIKRFIIY